MNDTIALVGIAVAIGLGLWGAITNTTIYFRIGSMATSLVACAGCAYSGWKPFFGGSHDVGTYFGCIMLTFGLVGWLFFRGVSDVNRSNRNPTA